MWFYCVGNVFANASSIGARRRTALGFAGQKVSQRDRGSSHSDECIGIAMGIADARIKTSKG
ncbi:hypothetical protein GCM10027287_41390 [Bordetella muralis]